MIFICLPYNIVDGSPNLFWDSSNWDLIPSNQAMKEPNMTVAHTIYTLNPEAKIIILIREPVSR